MRGAERALPPRETEDVRPYPRVSQTAPSCQGTSGSSSRVRRRPSLKPLGSCGPRTAPAGAASPPSRGWRGGWRQGIRSSPALRARG